MNRIDRMFSEKPGNILSVYMTAGYPRLESTLPIITYLQEAGVDMIEIGIPFSDPLADGPIIQKSSQAALSNGMTLNILFQQIHNLRKSIQVPLLLMGYLNPVLKFGFKRFLDLCHQHGIDGIILPDLPTYEFAEQYSALFAEAGICFPMLITPQTTLERISTITGWSSGFIYMVSDSSTTGARGKLTSYQIQYFDRISAMQLALPRLIGFGISSRETFSTACKYANGAIIGSAFIQSIEKSEISAKSVTSFIDSIRP